MGTRTVLKAGALLAIAAILGLGAVQGTLAAWNAATASKTQTVTTARFSLSIKAANAAAQQLSVSGQEVSLPGTTGLLPGTSRTTALTLTNTSDSGSGMLGATVDVGSPRASGALAAYLGTDIYRAQGTDCSVAAAPSQLKLAQGKSAVLCLRTTLAGNAPATLGGAGAKITFSLGSTQYP
jgi:predicted ribosomally synthesized peptide with SipW-like signal peptide